MKFTVKNKTEECTKDSNGHWITKDNKLVKLKNGMFARGCSEYVEPVEDAEFEEVILLPAPTSVSLVADIKLYLDQCELDYTGITLKADLLEMAIDFNENYNVD